MLLTMLNGQKIKKCFTKVNELPLNAAVDKRKKLNNTGIEPWVSLDEI